MDVIMSACWTSNGLPFLVLKWSRSVSKLDLKHSSNVLKQNLECTKFGLQITILQRIWALGLKLEADPRKMQWWQVALSWTVSDTPLVKNVVYCLWSEPFNVTEVTQFYSQLCVGTIKIGSGHSHYQHAIKISKLIPRWSVPRKLLCHLFDFFTFK